MTGYSLTSQQFATFASGGFNRVPVACRLGADLETPLSVYLKLANEPYTCLFESVLGGERWGRYSIITLASRQRVEVRAGEISVFCGQELEQQFQSADPLQWIREWQAQFKVPDLPDLPRFAGGLVGYFGYDTIRSIEARLAPGRKTAQPDMPEICLLLCDELVVFDNVSGALLLVVHADPALAGAYDRALERIVELRHKLATTRVVAAMADDMARPEPELAWSFPKQDFMQAVAKVKQHIVAGDVMQTVLSQRLQCACDVPPVNLYRALRALNPSPYMYYLDFGRAQIVGSSPEVLVRLERDMVTLRPIAGTRPRGADKEQDEALAADLLADPKELAEHLMLVDLGRNDAGRVSLPGKVEVTEQMVVERYSHVMHIVSNVSGSLRPGLDAIDVLRAGFPAGTVTGAPKIRAMELIDKYEPSGRGIYAGAIGYLAWSGDMDLAIAIRTAVIADGTLYLQAGAGIVADSDPEREWEETMNKGLALIRALSRADSRQPVCQTVSTVD